MKSKDEEYIKGEEKDKKTNNTLSSSHVLFRTTHLHIMESVG